MNAQLGLILGISSLILMGLGNAISKIPSKYYSSNTILFYSRFFTSLVTLVFLLFNLSSTTFDLKYILITIGIAIYGYFPIFFFYKGITSGKVGVISPISSSYVLITVFLSFLFYRENLSFIHLVLILLILLGVILISIDFREIKNLKQLFNRQNGIYFAILAAIGWGIYFFLMRGPIEHIGSVLSAFIVEFVIFLISALVILFNKEKINLKEQKKISTVAIMAIISAFGYVAFYQAIKVYSLSIVTAINAASPLVVCLFGAFVYKEKLELKQYLGILAIVLGIILIQIF